MVGSVHPIQTLELLVELLRSGFDGTIYFDTFPDHSGLDPVAEGAANIATTERLLMVAQQLTMSQELLNARIQQDPMKAQRIIQEALFR